MSLIIADLFNKQTGAAVLSVAFKNKSDLLDYTKRIKPNGFYVAGSQPSIHWRIGELLAYCYGSTYDIQQTNRVRLAAFKLTYPNRADK